MLLVCTLDVMWWKWDFVIFPTKIPNPSLIMRRTSDKIQYRGFLQHSWPVLLKTFKIIQKERKHLITQTILTSDSAKNQSSWLWLPIYEKPTERLRVRLPTFAVSSWEWKRTLVDSAWTLKWHPQKFFSRPNWKTSTLKFNSKYVWERER